MPNQHTVTISNFDGPFDLLLDLIRQHKMDITEISIAEVTSDFIKYIRKNKDERLSIGSEFIVIAAILLNIKAEQILSYDERSTELKNDFDLLFSRLLQYNAFRKLGRIFAQQIALNSLYYPRNFIPEKTTVIPGISVEMSDFYEIYKQFDTPKILSTEHITINKVNIEKERKVVKNIIKTKEKLTFEELVDDVREKQEYVVVRFLLILELFKDQTVELSQSRPFDSILIKQI